MAGRREEPGEKAGAEGHRNRMVGGRMLVFEDYGSAGNMLKIDAGVAASFFLDRLRAAYCVLLALLEHQNDSHP